MINDDRCETDHEHYDKVKKQVDIEFGSTVIYECEGEITLFRGIPATAEITKMTRIFVDHNGQQEEDSTVLDYEDFPHYITKAAEKKMTEEY